jgi:hypothetical protein
VTENCVSNADTMKKKKRKRNKKNNTSTTLNPEEKKNDEKQENDLLEKVTELTDVSQANDTTSEVNSEIQTNTKSVFSDNLKKRKRNKNKTKKQVDGNVALGETPQTPVLESVLNVQEVSKAENRKGKNKRTSILDELKEREEREKQEARVQLKNEIARREKLLGNFLLL